MVSRGAAGARAGVRWTGVGAKRAPRVGWRHASGRMSTGWAQASPSGGVTGVMQGMRMPEEHARVGESGCQVPAASAARAAQAWP